MENLGLDGMSLVIGLFIGLAVGFLFALLSRPNMRKTVDRVSNEMKHIFDSLSAEALEKSKAELEQSNQSLLNRLEVQSRFQTEQHIAELYHQKELIDQQLEQMSATLDKVPNQLENNQSKVSQVLQQSTEHLKESNQGFLNQLSEKADSQTKEHRQELESKKELIDQRLTQMDTKLGRVERLIAEFESARESKLGAWDD